MRSVSFCGKSVNILWVGICERCANTYTALHDARHYSSAHVNNFGVLPKLLQWLPTYLYTGVVDVSHLWRCVLYTVSTIPIIMNTKEKGLVI